MAIGDIKTFNYVFDDNRNNPLNHMEVEVTAIDNGDGTSRLVVKVVSGGGDINGIYWHDGVADGNVFALSPFPLHMNNVGQDWDGGVKLSDETSPHGKAVLKDTYLTAGETYTVNAANVDWNTIQTLGVRATNTNTKGNDVRGVDSSAVVTIANHAPVAVDKTVYAIEGVGTWYSQNLMAGDTDADGDGLRVVSVTHDGITYEMPLGGATNVTPVANGTFVAADWGHIIYNRSDGTMETGTATTDTFTYVVADEHGNTDTADFNILVAAKPEISISDLEVVEGSGPGIFTVNLTNPFAFQIQAGYQVMAGTASGDDVAITAGTVYIVPGQTSVSVNVDIADDGAYEGNEQFRLVLDYAIANFPDGQIPLGLEAAVTDWEGVGTIIDDDAPPQLSINDVTVTEGDFAPFVASLDHPYAYDVTFEYHTADGVGTAQPVSDYWGFSNAFATIPAGSTSVGLPMFQPTQENDVFEPTETLVLELSGATANVNGTAVDLAIFDNQGVATILDDDPPAPTNSAPVAVDDQIQAGEQNTVTGNFLTNDLDADGDALILTSVTFPFTGGVPQTFELADYIPAGNTTSFLFIGGSGGDLRVRGDGSFSYHYNGSNIPDGGQSTVEVPYTVSDGVAEDIGQLNITINADTII